MCEYAEAPWLPKAKAPAKPPGGLCGDGIWRGGDGGIRIGVTGRATGSTATAVWPAFEFGGPNNNTGAAFTGRKLGVGLNMRCGPAVAVATAVPRGQPSKRSAPGLRDRATAASCAWEAWPTSWTGTGTKEWLRLEAASLCGELGMLAAARTVGELGTDGGAEIAAPAGSTKEPGGRCSSGTTGACQRQAGVRQ